MNYITPKQAWDLNAFHWVNEKKLPGFGKLLESWLNVHRNFCAGAAPEHPWAYAERPQIGLLSNAAILLGGIALEEWCAEKKSDTSKVYSGRNDLWLRLSPHSNERDYQIESKHARLDLRKNAIDLESIITEALRWARVDSGRLGKKNGKPVGIAFLTLRFESEDAEALENKTRDLCYYIQAQDRQNNQLDAMAAIWLGVEDFLLCRSERNRIAKEQNTNGWPSDEVGLILLASCAQ
jgi:hypothetical protein